MVGKLRPGVIAELIGPPLIAAGVGFGLRLLPNEVIDVLTIWLMLSLPVGVLIGHCSLNDDEELSAPL